VPEVAPASSQRDGAVPGAAGEGKGRCGSPPPGPGTEGPSRGKTLSPPRHEGICPDPSVYRTECLPSPGELGGRP